MAERFGLDSNVLVYLLDRREPARQTRARHLLELAGRTGRCVLSVQNLGELYAAASRKRLSKPGQIRSVIEDLITLFPIVSPRAPDVLTAIAATGRFAYGDALLLATLGTAGCTALLSEDMQDGGSLAGVTVRNPFAGDALPPAVAALLA